MGRGVLVNEEIEDVKGALRGVVKAQERLDVED